MINDMNESYIEPSAIAYAPERIDDKDPGVDCHALYNTFLTLIPQYACNPAAVCQALKWSDTMTAGFVISEGKKEMAQIYFAAHLLQLGAVAALTDQARTVSAVKGTAPSIPSGDAARTVWLNSTIWGQSFLGMGHVNPKVGFIVA